MNKRAMKASAGLCLAVVVAGAAAVGCGQQGGSGGAAGGIQPQVMADAIYSVIAADRAVYTREVVNRLTSENAIKASEHFKDDKALPLPAQMLRMGAEQSQKTNPSFTYALLSVDPINKQNAPKTEAEKAGLKFVADNPGKNYYGDEKLGDKTYFTAVYADKATVEACAKCHNEHADSPRKDWKVGDTMGALVIRIPKG
ncbi:Tll0287-like domain-containing protein [Polyangium aurulentum]|uniref:Tll0287-like domain-containing protein n=1 Tax=Polyangium aurulentum TaxID=2567896 RepID=UPI001981FDAB|nr:DUF3365 domain-containing protein [Polyangium aurulentum]UQA59406.1 DUF3365 domain-containing protein [Polyangium aurulentum]